MSAALVKRADRFVETEIDGETVIFSLSGNALSMWQDIDGSHDRASLLALLAAENRASEHELAADDDAFVADLKAAKLIEGD